MNGRLEKENILVHKTYNLMNDLPDFVEEWYSKMEASDKTASTRYDFVKKIKRYLQTVNNNAENITTEDLSYKTVINYMNSIKIRKNANGEIISTSGSYQRTVWSALNSFFSFLYKRKYIDSNPMDDIDVSRKKDDARINRNRKYLTIEDFGKILKEAENSRGIKAKTRNKAILMIMMCTGIRCRALTQINLDDINYEKKVVTVIDKENLERDCSLTDKTIEAIQEWLTYRGNTNTKALFVSTQGNRISEEDVSFMIKRFSELGLGIKISPHKIRAGFGTILYNETKDIRYVQEAMGHSNIQTTQRYAVVKQDQGKEITKVFGNL